MIDDMLTKVDDVCEMDFKMLWSYCKATGVINSYNQFRVNGIQVSDRFMEVISGTKHASDVMLILSRTHLFSNILMKNRQTAFNSLGELYDELGIGERTGKSITKFMKDNDIMRVYKSPANKSFNRLVINPFDFRRSSWTSMFSLMTFPDKIVSGGNIDSYCCNILQIEGVL